VVVSFDRLHTGHLGCCGNDWIETPNLDRLAAEAVFFDQHFSDNLDLQAANHAWWTGRCQFPLDEAGQRASPPFVETLHSHGVKTCLLVESDGSDDTAVAPPFGEVIAIRGYDGFDVSEDETPFARVVMRCEEWLRESAHRSGPELLWIKSRGVPIPWVAPQAFADLYLADFGLVADKDALDEAGDAETAAPCLTSSGEEDETATERDGSLDWRYAAAMHAACTTLLDRWLGKFLEALADSPAWKDALLIVTSGTGQSLGEHVPLEEEALLLRSEMVQPPLWVRVPGTDQGCTRRQALVQAIDLAPTLLEWFGVSSVAHVPQAAPVDPFSGRSLLPLVRNDSVAPRDVLLMGNGRLEWGIRTGDFFYVEPGDAHSNRETSLARLFEKPADRWDQSDVLSQYPQVAEKLQALLRRQIESMTGSHSTPANNG
jgi:arylsulfatase A-like enzyme